MAFLDYVGERHKVWEARQRGDAQPWTDDPILATRKFTNVFRLLDPGSQFVITDLYDPDLEPVEFLTRCFLYRHTGRVEAWEYLGVTLGEYPTSNTLDEALRAWKEYRGRGVTTKKPPRRPGQKGPGNGNQSTSFERPVFTGAYLVFPQSATPGTDKLESIIDLTKRMRPSFEAFVKAGTQAERFAALRSNKGVADFMSMQVLTDFGYSTEYREHEFVVPGPGCRKGAAALGLTGEEAIEWAMQAVFEDPPTLSMDEYGEEYLVPSRMDVQNCLCEFSKYVRFADKPSPQKPYAPAHPGVQLPPVLPPLWHNTI